MRTNSPNQPDSVSSILKDHGRLFYKLNETAEIFGVSESTIRRWIRDGFMQRSTKLRHIQISVTEIARVSQELESECI